MADVNKNYIIKKSSLFNQIDDRKKEIIQNQKIYHNNLSSITKKRLNLNGSTKKILNLVDFIKQKNKFFLESSFDAKGTREFLASKEIAMKSIKLNDEIIENKKGKTNKNLVNLKLLNFQDNEIKKKETPKTVKKSTISPRKSRKSQKIRNGQTNTEIKVVKTKKPSKSKKSPKKRKNKSPETESKENSSNLKSSNNNSNREKNIFFDKSNNDSLSNIYKFFIDHANEPEENFQKKLKKELKKVDNLKQNKNKRKSKSKKNIEYIRPKRMKSVIVKKRKDCQSAFMFSEINKNLMKKDDLELSSIEDDKNDIYLKHKNKKQIKRAYGSIQFNNKKIHEQLKEKMRKNDNSEINFEKDSLISILSDLM